MTPLSSLWRGLIDVASFFRTWRTTLAGLIVGFLIGQGIALAWLVISPGKAARERQALEAASRDAAARCFKLVSQDVNINC